MKILLLSGYSFIFVLTLFLGIINVSATTFSPTNNMFENSYSNNLIDMASSQIKNFTNKKYAIFVVDNSYFLVSSDDVSITNNSITFTNSDIISAVRNGSYNYNYNTSTESSTTINTSYMIISNIDFSKSVNSTRFTDYSFRNNITYLAIFILAICFALLLRRL